MENLDKVDFYFVLCKYSLNLVSLQFRGVREKKSDIPQWNPIWALFVRLSQCFKQWVVDLQL